MHILVTGCAGFIGHAFATKVLQAGHQVTGVDSLNNYYDPQLKHSRLANLQQLPGFNFQHFDLTDEQQLAALFQQHDFDRVVHLAAQAGVRYSLENPQVYIQSNLVGFANILEQCRQHNIAHLLYASSSSVYGGNSKQPFSETDRVDKPLSLYAATKRSNEHLAYSYAHLYQLPCTGLRFFTVYGPWGRPDMALFKFCQQMLAGDTIDVYNHGKMARDFTYIDDIVESVYRLLDCVPDSSAAASCRVVNIAHGKPEQLMDFIEVLASELRVTPKLNYMELQAGDVPNTFADTRLLQELTNYQPKVAIAAGIAAFVAWYKQYYRC